MCTCFLSNLKIEGCVREGRTYGAFSDMQECCSCREYTITLTKCASRFHLRLNSNVCGVCAVEDHCPCCAVTELTECGVCKRKGATVCKECSENVQCCIRCMKAHRRDAHPKEKCKMCAKSPEACPFVFCDACGIRACVTCINLLTRTCVACTRH